MFGYKGTSVGESELHFPLGFVATGAACTMLGEKDAERSGIGDGERVLLKVKGVFGTDPTAASTAGGSREACTARWDAA